MIETISSLFVPIEIQNSVEAENMYGDTVCTWTTTKVIDGLIRQLSSKELLTARKLDTLTTHRLYTKDIAILPSDRIYYNNIAYRIVARPNNVMNMNELLQVDLEVINDG